MPKNVQGLVVLSAEKRGGVSCLASLDVALYLRSFLCLLFSFILLCNSLFFTHELVLLLQYFNRR